MIVYLVRDMDPSGGYLSAQTERPPLIGREAVYVDEIRVVEDFPEDVWDLVVAGGLPVDPGGAGHDLVWMPWWEDAETVWKK